ncbi:heavy metal translocating P-type ATPase [Flavobacterium antarcticum]|uniref:heavy metal translocating P-type ATPase n=1 Tax=Flavobacterium antarcticum TaxID=271155 RepID=UPI0003B518F5|nr:heavy metal translocating P-type ATPase [Flavobacterium antarcticum]
MKHPHSDCCSTSPEENKHDHEHSHDHDHEINTENKLALFGPALGSFALLIVGLVLDYLLKPLWFTETYRLILYSFAYLPVGFPVVKEAWVSIKKGDVFSEFFLMTIATLGAFAIGEFPEGVAVMLFYTIGELFQGMAVTRAKANIKSLLDSRPEEVTIIDSENKTTVVKAAEVAIGQIMQLKPGEKVALDGILLSEKSSFNTSALTGESVPDSKVKTETVLAGMINLNSVSHIEVTTKFSDSKLSKILLMVQDATSRKAPTELFITKFAKIYTPIVVGLAILICFVPALFVENYVFSDWLYRALVFLVISCPCALVISIPLGYFGGIGAASKNGILFKGSNFLDLIAQVNHVVMDKTGTMTEGVFKVQQVAFKSKFDEKEILNLVNVLESQSSHPVATAIHEYIGAVDSEIQFSKVEEIPGLGLKGVYNGADLLVGNFKLMDKFSINHQINVESIVFTTIAVAYQNEFVGYLTISDTIKKEAQTTINQLNALQIKTTLLSGDKNAVVQEVATTLGIATAFGDLLPEDKVSHLTKIKLQDKIVAFVGDGVNDAPVVALSDIGIAMGGLGSDATIETADVVIQDDNPSKIPLAIAIGKKTKQIVWQNITLAFVVKGLVLILGAGGLATMWEAVFADVGVALLAILNAIRIQKMKF